MHAEAEHWRWEEAEDGALLAAIREGDHAAFAALVRRHAERFYRVAWRFTRSRQEAEDIVQEAFLRLWQEPQRFEEDRKVKFTTWFYRVVVNRCLDWQQKKRPAPLPEHFEVASSDEAADETLIRREQQRRLEREIASLPERQRTALNLCFNDGLSNQEAADVMEIHLKALQSLLMRAKTTLKERMASYG